MFRIYFRRPARLHARTLRPDLTAGLNVLRLLVSSKPSAVQVRNFADYAACSDDQLQIVLSDTVFERSYWIVTHLDMRESVESAQCRVHNCEVAQIIFRRRKCVSSLLQL